MEKGKHLGQMNSESQNNFRPHLDYNTQSNMTGS